MDNLESRNIYNEERLISRQALYSDRSTPYSRELVDIRLNLIKQYSQGKRILDLCCGTGAYLTPISSSAKTSVGLDFSLGMLREFSRLISQSGVLSRIGLVAADANDPPLASRSFDLVFSYIALYQVPNVQKAIHQTARVLDNGGIAILELGNQNSINARISLLSYKQGKSAKPFLIPYKEMHNLINGAGFRILEHRVFQILPMWGPRTIVYLPVTTKLWKHILGLKFKGRMLDEWISSSRWLRRYAFRHFVICQKGKDYSGSLIK
ncbi:MAG: class I SAM-dependent methyltransferase [Anaerolineales bacterium]